jgi:hypothetical protein
MTEVSDIGTALIGAYLAAVYRVRGPQPFAMQVDVPCPALARLHRASGVRCSAFLTAHNPRSEPTTAAMNRAAQARLRRHLRGAGLAWRAGFARDPAGAWPDEPSLLVLGLPRNDAEALARAFGQNALLWAGADALPRLVLVR